jgi:hypothetical protein
VVVRDSAGLQLVHLPALQQLGGGITLERNPDMLYIVAQSLPDVPGSIQARDNAKLEWLLLGIESLGGDLRLERNGPEANLHGLVNLRYVAGDVVFANNSRIHNLNPVANVEWIGGGLTIQSNPALTSITALTNLHKLDGSLSISYNGSLADLGPLQGLTEIPGSLTLISNPSLNDLDGLHRVTAIGGNALLRDLDGLYDLRGLEGLRTVSGGLRIQNNQDLRYLSGPPLESVGDLRVISNPSLRNLNGLAGLDRVTVAGVDIGFNDSISSVSALSGLSAIRDSTGRGGYLYIRGNRNLATCAAESVAEDLGMENLSVYIAGNNDSLLCVPSFPIFPRW